MTYKDQEVVTWSSVLMHAKKKKKNTIKNKESWSAMKSVTNIFFSAWTDPFLLL